MNEKIKELADEAEIYVDRFHADDAKELYWIKYKEKFAELIVKECASIVYRTCEDGDAGAQAILYEFDIDDAKSQK